MLKSSIIIIFLNVKDTCSGYFADDRKIILYTIYFRNKHMNHHFRLKCSIDMNNSVYVGSCLLMHFYYINCFADLFILDASLKKQTQQIRNFASCARHSILVTTTQRKAQNFSE